MQHVGELEVGPEVTGVRLLDSPQEREPLRTVVRQLPLECQQQRHGLVGDRGRPDHLVEGRLVPQDFRVAGAAAPARRVRVPVRASRHAQHPAQDLPVDGDGGPVVEGGHQCPWDVRRPDPGRDRLRVVADLPEPGPAKRRLVRVVGRVMGLAGRWCGRDPAGRPGPGRGRPVPGGGERDRPAVAQPDLRSLQRGAGLRPGRLVEIADHLPQVGRRGPLRGGPLVFEPSRVRRPLGDQPEPAADQADHGQRPGRDRRREHRPAADPAGQPPQPPLRPRRDRLAPEEAVEVLRQRGGAGIAEVRLLVQALQADGLQVAGHAGVQPRRGHRLLGEHLLQRFRRRLRPERRPAREQLVEDRPQGIDVHGRPPHPARPGPAPGPCSSASRARCRSGSQPAPPSSRRASPKSPILGVPSAVSSTFAGFRSRWTIPPWCAAWTASARVADERGGLTGR